MTNKLNRNQLLEMLSEADRRRLKSHLEIVELERMDELYLPNEPIEHVHFITKGVASLVKHTQEAQVEIATVGPEGMIGVPVFLGSETADNHAFMQVAGSSLRMDVRTFDIMLTNIPTLRRILSRYTLALLNQVAQSAACNRAHEVDARCARWLLMTHDRVRENTFPLTHEFLAQMLGVHRPTVSIAAGMLQKAGLIQYTRGVVTITDRKGLERASCDCYEAIVREYERLLHEPRSRKNHS